MNVATILRASLVIVSTLTSVDAVCTGGIAGVEATSADVCCVEDCGVCGDDTGCAEVSGVNSTLTANDCCSSEIIESSVFCVDSGAAPCILTAGVAGDSNSTCSNDLPGIEDTVNLVCCDVACDLCGGPGCGNVTGLSGDDCCSETIANNGTLCSVAGEAPCIIDLPEVTSNSTCSNGFSGFEDTVNFICCDVACGLCGGTGCGSVPGLTGSDCCSETIANNGTLCSVAGEAPCILELPEVTTNSTCSNELPGFEDSVNGVCCDVACGLCGGAGCGNVPGLTGNDCCSETIANNGSLCSVAGEAPCILDLPEVTSNSTCSNGFSGFEDTLNFVCCDVACGLCGGPGCGNVPGLTGNDCCSETIATNGTLCPVAEEAPCILELPEVTSNDTCSNGLSGFEDTVNFVCCDVACGLCGGPGCGNVPGLTGNDCCSETIATNGTLCSVAREAPCILELPEVTSNSTCSNGFSGFEDTVNFVCCDVACGLCGGSGCGNVPGLTGNDCCSETIATNGTLCSVAGEAPCIVDLQEVTSNSTCSNGFSGFEDTVNFVCCDVACGLCGGSGCGNVPGLTGSDCCSETIATNGTLCSVAGEAPCILDPSEVTSNSTCSNGFSGFEDTVNFVCCDVACGLCGGPGCGNVPGLTGSDCCSGTIATNGTLCSVAGEAPCIVDPSEVTSNSTCSNGFSGFEDTVNFVCCDVACGLCGGPGCGNVPGLTGSDCCSDTIATNGTLCSVAGEAPCIVDPPDVTSNSTCSNNLAGFEDTDDGVCCDLACGLCGGPGCGSVPGLTGDDCCSGTIAANGTFCSVTGAAPCIIDPPEVTPSMCPNGLPGVQNGNICCAEACNGVCGGEGCGSILGTEGSSDCCSAIILAAGVFCVDGVVAPCIMVNGTFTPAPSFVLTTAISTITPREVIFTEAPTVEGQTEAPTHSPTRTPTQTPTQTPTATPSDLNVPVPTAAPSESSMAPTAVPTPVTRDVPTSGPSMMNTTTPTTSGATTPSTGNLITLVALVAGTFAVLAAARH